jgi:hypothetical protein
MKPLGLGGWIGRVGARQESQARIPRWNARPENGHLGPSFETANRQVKIILNNFFSTKKYKD